MSNDVGERRWGEKEEINESHIERRGLYTTAESYAQIPENGGRNMKFSALL